MKNHLWNVAFFWFWNVFWSDSFTNNRKNDVCSKEKKTHHKISYRTLKTPSPPIFEYQAKNRNFLSDRELGKRTSKLVLLKNDFNGFVAPVFSVHPGEIHPFSPLSSPFALYPHPTPPHPHLTPAHPHPIHSIFRVLQAFSFSFSQVSLFPFSRRKKWEKWGDLFLSFIFLLLSRPELHFVSFNFLWLIDDSPIFSSTSHCNHSSCCRWEKPGWCKEEAERYLKKKQSAIQ